MDSTTKKIRKKTNGVKKEKKYVKLRKHLAEVPLVVEGETIWLDGNLRGDTPPVIRCTCGWNSDPSENLLELGLLAKEHEVETGHLRRSHG